MASRQAWLLAMFAGTPGRYAVSSNADVEIPTSGAPARPQHPRVTDVVGRFTCVVIVVGTVVRTEKKITQITGFRWTFGYQEMARLNLILCIMRIMVYSDIVIGVKAIVRGESDTISIVKQSRQV